MAELIPAVEAGLEEGLALGWLSVKEVAVPCEDRVLALFVEGVVIIPAIHDAWDDQGFIGFHGFKTMGGLEEGDVVVEVHEDAHLEE